MLEPPPPGRGLQDEFAALGVTVAEAANALGVSRSQLYRVMSGQSGISPELALRLETVVGGSTGQWLRMQAAYDAAEVRRRAPEITRGLRKLQPAE